MYNIRPYPYVPAPQPATSDRIVAAHYYAAWKKGAAGLHEGFDDLSETFPDRTPLMGYYDEENPEVCDWEIKWALEHGVNCFIYCWYRKKDNMGKPVTVSDLRCGHGIHEALFRAKYGNQMKFAIMFEASPRWGGTDREDMVKNLMPFWTKEYFSRENYLKIDGKPVLFVYSQPRLAAECFRDAREQKETFDACREYAKAQGFDGLIFAWESSQLTPESLADGLSRGFDFHFGYSSGYSGKNNFPPAEEPLEGQLDILKKRLAFAPDATIPTATCFRDSTPRFSERWNALGYRFREWGNIWYLPPEKYRDLLLEMVKLTDALPEGAWGRKILMLDNWNEWDEGHFIAPSMEFGFRYLEAVREALTKRDNLPDYRTPQELGFGSYNKSWRTPDFADFCRKKLEAGEKVFPGEN